MKAALMYGTRDIRLEEVPIPEIETDEVLIRVRSVGICGSEVHTYDRFDELKGHWGIKGPVIMGHEFAGDVVKVGSRVSEVKVGNRVVVDPNRVCESCYSCQMSEKNCLCDNLTVYGKAYAEYTKAYHKNVYPISQEVSYNEAAQTEPLSCALRGIDVLPIRAGETFAVLGCGPTGLLFIQLGRLYGASIICAVGRREESLKKAQEVGADILINSEAEDAVSGVRKATGDKGSSVVIETIGKSPTMRMAVEMAAKRGRVCLFAVPYDQQVTFPSWDFYDKELLLTGSNRNPGTFQRALAIIESKRINTVTLITHRIRLNELPEAFNMLIDRQKRREAKVIKVIVNP